MDQHSASHPVLVKIEPELTSELDIKSEPDELAMEVDNSSCSNQEAMMHLPTLATSSDECDDFEIQRVPKLEHEDSQESCAMSGRQQVVTPGPGVDRSTSSFNQDSMEQPPEGCVVTNLSNNKASILEFRLLGEDGTASFNKAADFVKRKIAGLPKTTVIIVTRPSKPGEEQATTIIPLTPGPDEQQNRLLSATFTGLSASEIAGIRRILQRGRGEGA